MTTSLLKAASAFALFAALGIGGAQAQQTSGATRQIAVEPAQAAPAEAPAETAPAQEPAAAQASPAPEAPAATAEAPAAEKPATPEATGAVPVEKPAPATKPAVKAVVKVAVAKAPHSVARHVGYGGSAYGRRNCH